MNLVLAKTDAKSAARDVFAAAANRLPGTGPVAQMRERAFEAYERAGLPHRRIEEWKYTDLRALMRDVLPLAPAPDEVALRRAEAAMTRLAIADTQLLVLVDGVLAPTLSDLASLESGFDVRALASVLGESDNDAGADLLESGAIGGPMISLNAAMATDGLLVTVREGAVLNKPLHILHVATRASAATYTRSFVTVGKGARATLLESFIAADGAQAYQSNDNITVWIGEEAELQHVRLLSDAKDATNITTAIFTAGAKARLNTLNMTTGAGLSRYQGYLTFAGEGAEVTANGVSLLNGRQHADNTLFLDHAVANCRSREVFRSVVDDSAHSVSRAASWYVRMRRKPTPR